VSEVIIITQKIVYPQSGSFQLICVLQLHFFTICSLGKDADPDQKKSGFSKLVSGSGSVIDNLGPGTLILTSVVYPYIYYTDPDPDPAAEKLTTNLNILNIL